MTPANIEDVHPLRRNLIVICLLILVYSLGGGHFRVHDDGVVASIGLIAVAFERPWVLKGVAIFIFAWSWYRWEVFDKSKTAWSQVVANIRGHLQHGAGRASLTKASARVDHRHRLDGEGSGVIPNSLNLEIAGFFEALYASWIVKNAPFNVKGKYASQVHQFALGWQEYPLKVQLLWRGISRTEYLPSVILPNILIFATLVAIFGPLYGIAYTTLGVLWTVAINVFVLVSVYWSECKSLAAWILDRFPEGAGSSTST
ncbi:hypothetical protein [Microbulbifer sp. JSM ZJ756]|uniref:hypothetical protein n=1 Tax=Microbulbifer sp. JSM ZJ756 TaxID=3376191 RepID=UPI0037A8E332